MAAWTEERKKAVSEAAKKKREELLQKTEEIVTAEPVVVEPQEEIIDIHEEEISPMQKIEQFNGEKLPAREERSGMNDWTEEDKIASITNTIKILPPNLIKNGRHEIKNIQAINVFTITQELVDKAYSKFQHDL